MFCIKLNICALILFFSLLLTASTSFSNTPVYYMHLKDTGEKVICLNLLLDEDSFRCTIDNAIYIYNIDIVNSVTYNKSTIYPYDRTVRLTEDVLLKKDCDFIKRNLPGSLFLERTPEVYLFVGLMFEYGKCATQSNDKAFQYYQKAGAQGRQKFYALQEKLKANEPMVEKAVIDREFLVTLQRESDIKRIEKAAQTKVCNVECSYKLESDMKVEEKFRVNQQCFDDCMHVNGF